MSTKIYHDGAWMMDLFEQVRADYCEAVREAPAAPTIFDVFTHGVEYEVCPGPGEVDALYHDGAWTGTTGQQPGHVLEEPATVGLVAQARINGFWGIGMTTKGRGPAVAKGV